MGVQSLRLDTTATITLASTNVVPVLDTAPTQTGFSPQNGPAATLVTLSSLTAFVGKNIVTGTRTIAAMGTTQNSTPTAAQLLGGVVTQTGATGAGTVTLPTGAVLSAAITSPVAGTSFECVFQNLGGGQTLTITAGASGMTIIGTAAVPTGKASRLTFVCTATDTWSVFCSVSA